MIRRAENKTPGKAAGSPLAVPRWRLGLSLPRQRSELLLEFHPHLLLAAAPIEQGGAICFHREIGEAFPNLVGWKQPPAGEVSTDRCFVSPEGEHLLLECQADGKRFLRRAPLGLAAADRAKFKP